MDHRYSRVGAFRESRPVRMMAAAALLGALLALGATGCARQTPQAAVSPAPAATTPSVTASPTAQPATSTITPPAGGVDAAGAAAGTPLTVGSASKPVKPGGIPRPTDKTAIDATLKYARQSEGIGKVTSVSVRAMTQDKKGHWWVLVAITDKTQGSNEAVMTYDGKTWDDQIFGEGISNGDLPRDVRF